MRAIVMSAFGGPEVLVESDVEDPVAGPGQVLIDVEVVNITFVETQIRAGRPPRPSMLPELPVIPGNGVGGLVAAVGPSVSDALVGSRVVTSTGGSGAYADSVAVPAEGLLSVPDPLSLTDAAALLADGRTALGLLGRAEVAAGDTVLVEAAAGGVGSLLVQLAASAGARVIAVAGGERKVELARELGAEIAIDYTAPDWARQVAAGDGRPLDVVFDGVGGATARASFELLAPGGRFCAYGMASGSFAPITDQEARDRGVQLRRGAVPDPHEAQRLTAAALERAAGGKLRPVIGQTFPLARAADAHRAIETRSTIGKTLLLTA